MWNPAEQQHQTQLMRHYDYNRNGQLARIDLGDGGSEYYQHDALGRLTGQTTEHGAQYHFGYDARDRRVQTELSNWTHSYQYHSLYDGRQEHSQWDPNHQPYRTLNYLPGEPGNSSGLPESANYGTLISQTVHQWQNNEFRVTGEAQTYADKAYFHQDHLGSTVKITGANPSNAYRWDYTPMGEAYGFTNRYRQEHLGSTHNGHSPKRHLVPYLYTGKYETSLTGLIHMDARWYNPQLGRWLQPDYYSFGQLALPQSARHKLLASTQLNTAGLLRDPSQQMAYGYVAGNPLRWVDPMGLTTWTGTVKNVAVSVGVGGTGSQYELSAVDPETGETVNVTIGSNLIVLGAGINVGGAVSNVTFEDKNEKPDPEVFNGMAVGASASWAVVFGYSVSTNTLGGAIQSGPSIQVGYDASIMAGIGTSWVMDVDIQPASSEFNLNPIEVSSKPNLSGHRNIPC